MDSPGLSVSPIHSVSGDHEVNQVFFDNVRVPVDRLVGEEGKGWTCAKYLLGFERGGALKAARLEVELAHIHDLLPKLRLSNEARELWQEKIARLQIRLQALSFTEMRIIQQLALQGGDPGPEASVLKVEFTEIQQKITELAVDVLGPFGLAHAKQGSTQRESIPGLGVELSQAIAPLLPRYLNFRAASIYGGSNEIQRNIIAKTVLGLP
jgi:acyl-CoA dehydrogenase